MVIKSLKELVNVDNISQEKTWWDLLNAIKGFDTDDPINIDMSGINITDPWEIEAFHELMNNENIYLTFTNKKELVNRIKMWCTINGYYPENVINIEVEYNKPKTAKELKLEREGNNVKAHFHLIDGNREAIQNIADTNILKSIYELNVADLYTQIYSGGTIENIRWAIDQLVKESGIKHYRLVINDIPMQDNVIDSLAKLILEYQDNGIMLEVASSNTETTDKFTLYIFNNSNKEYTEDEKATIIQENFKPGMPGLLIRYKKTRATDDFGRYGDGKPASCRIAVYKGLVDDETGRYVIIDSYNDDTFYTKQHWKVDNDNEDLDKLSVDEHKITLDEIGMTDFFFGSTYHFIKPIQRSIDESRNVIVDLNENGGNITERCTIPERMKHVFDDWGIEYDAELLKEYIDETNNSLGIIK